MVVAYYESKTSPVARTYCYVEVGVLQIESSRPISREGITEWGWPSLTWVFLNEKSSAFLTLECGEDHQFSLCLGSIFPSVLVRNFFYPSLLQKTLHFLKQYRTRSRKRDRECGLGRGRVVNWITFTMMSTCLMCCSPQHNERGTDVFLREEIWLGVLSLIEKPKWLLEGCNYVVRRACHRQRQLAMSRKSWSFLRRVCDLCWKEGLE